MNSILRLIIIALTISALGCNAGPPADVAGYWGGGYDITATITPCSMELKQEGDKITGTYDAFEAASQTGLSGKITGTVSGDKVTLELEVPKDVKEKRSWSDLTMTLVAKEEEGQRVLAGWTKRMDGENKLSMETLLTKEDSPGE